MASENRYLIFCWAFLSIFLATGCAHRVFKVDLAEPMLSDTKTELTVVDERADKQLKMFGISNANRVSGYLFNPVPEEIKVIQSHLSQILQNAPQVSKVRVSLTELELVNKVGFATNDELYCAIESKVSVFGKLSKEKIVRTNSKNVSNLSPFVYVAAKVILDQCLREHSQMIAAAVLNE